MIEVEVLELLKDDIGVDLYMEEPPKPPKQYIVFERIAQSVEGRGFLYITRLTTQSHAESLYKATALNDKLIPLLLQLPDNSSNITRVDIESSVNYSDPAKKEYIMQCTFDITHY